jgi:hypothetical protein
MGRKPRRPGRSRNVTKLKKDAVWNARKLACETIEKYVKSNGGKGYDSDALSEVLASVDYVRAVLQELDGADEAMDTALKDVADSIREDLKGQ